MRMYTKVEMKIFFHRVKVVSLRLFLFSLGVVTGVSYMVAYTVYGEETTMVFENSSLVVENGKSADRVVAEEKWKTGEFTAYSAGDGFTPSDTMASGKKVYVGAVACPSFLSLGDRIEVRGVGVFTCEDRMAMRYRDGSFFDIYKESKSAALAFGRRSMEWRVLAK